MTLISLCAFLSILNLWNRCCLNFITSSMRLVVLLFFSFLCKRSCHLSSIIIEAQFVLCWAKDRLLRHPRIKDTFLLPWLWRYHLWSIFFLILQSRLRLTCTIGHLGMQLLLLILIKNISLKWWHLCLYSLMSRLSVAWPFDFSWELIVLISTDWFSREGIHLLFAGFLASFPKVMRSFRLLR